MEKFESAYSLESTKGFTMNNIKVQEKKKDTKKAKINNKKTKNRLMN